MTISKRPPPKTTIVYPLECYGLAAPKHALRKPLKACNMEQQAGQKGDSEAPQLHRNFRDTPGHMDVAQSLANVLRQASRKTASLHVLRTLSYTYGRYSIFDVLRRRQSASQPARPVKFRPASHMSKPSQVDRCPLNRDEDAISRASLRKLRRRRLVLALIQHDPRVLLGFLIVASTADKLGLRLVSTAPHATNQTALFGGNGIP